MVGDMNRCILHWNDLGRDNYSSRIQITLGANKEPLFDPFARSLLKSAIEPLLDRVATRKS